MKIDNTAELTKQILLAASKMGARLWRRNVGTAWAGRSTRITKAQTVTLQPGDIVVHQGRPFHNGEAGQSDLWGFVPVTITADMVGQTIPVHAEVEIKFGADRMRPEQEKWRSFCEKNKVRFGVARTVEDAIKVLSPE